LFSRLAFLATKNKTVEIAFSSSNLYSEALHENVPVAGAKQLDRSMKKTIWITRLDLLADWPEKNFLAEQRGRFRPLLELVW